MSHQQPSVEDEVERALRLGLATASQIADRYARARQDLARQELHRDQQEARQLQARYRAEGVSATTRLALVDRPEWWNRATPADITSMWQLAVQWQDEQPRAATATETIARQVHDRYGIDVRDPGVDAETLRVAVARLDEEQRDLAGRPQGHEDTATAVGAVLRAEQRDAALAWPADEQQEVSAVEEAPEVDPPALLELEADQYDRQSADGGTATLTPEELRALSADARAQASLHRSEVSSVSTPAEPGTAPPYDSIERREQTATDLRGAGLSVTAVAVAIRADIAHARPPAEAVTARGTTGPDVGTRGGTRGAQRPDRGR